jgi:hypothetical protein
MRVVGLALLVVFGGCARAVGSRADARDLGVGGGGGGVDLASGEGADLGSGAAVDLAGGAVDLAGGSVADLASARDLGGGGVIGGGACLSGAAGGTAIRVRWTNAGGTAQVQYEAFGLPDHSREKVGAYGYQIGFTPQFVDPFLGDGGLLLDGSDFVDFELSGVGISSIASAKLAIFGRSYDTTTSGGFSWLSFSDSGVTASDFVSNVAPYRWYVADIGDTIGAGDAGVRVRIKADGLSGSLVVNRIEICMSAS